MFAASELIQKTCFQLQLSTLALFSKKAKATARECKNCFSFPSNFFNEISRITHQNMLMASRLMTAMKNLSLLHRMISGAPQRARRCWTHSHFFSYFERSCSSERNGTDRMFCCSVRDVFGQSSYSVRNLQNVIAGLWRSSSINTVVSAGSLFKSSPAASFKPQTKHNISEFR